MSFNNLSDEQLELNLKRSFASALFQTEKESFYRARVGNGAGVVQTGRTNYVFVRLAIGDTLQVAEALCYKLNVANDLPVRVRYNVDDVLEIIDFDVQQAQGYYSGSPVGLSQNGPHAPSHGLYGDDPLYIDKLQISGLQTLYTAANPPSVYVTPYWYTYNGDSYAFTGGTLDLSAHLPTGLNQQRVAIVGLDKSTGTLGVLLGTAEAFTGLSANVNPFTVEDMAGLYNGSFEPSAGVRLKRNQTAIYSYDLIADARQWGAGSGASGNIVDPSVCDFLANASSVAPSDPYSLNSFGTTLYLQPTKGTSSRVALWNGSAWQYHISNGTSIPIDVGTTAGTQAYTAYLYDNSGTLTAYYESGLNVEYRDGVRVHIGTNTARAIATFYVYTAGTVEDLHYKRLIDNDVQGFSKSVGFNITSDYTIPASTAGTSRAVNNSTTFEIQVWSGFNPQLLSVEASAMMLNVGTAAMYGTLDFETVAGASSISTDRSYPKPAGAEEAQSSAVFVANLFVGNSPYRVQLEEQINTGSALGDVEVRDLSAWGYLEPLITP